MTVISVDPSEMLGIAVVVLFLGVFLTPRIPFLKIAVSSELGACHEHETPVT